MRGRVLGLCLAIILAGMLVVWVGAQNAVANASRFGPENYSATMVMQSPGSKTQRIEVARRGSMWRVRIAMPGREGATVTQLADYASRTAYMIMPQMCMKTAMPDLAPADVLQQAERQNAKVVDMGPAAVAVGGKTYACEHLQVTGTDQGKTTVADIYTAHALQNLPVKMVLVRDGKTTTVTYEDIQLTAPPASEFTPPANCRTMPSVPGMGNLPGLPTR